MTPPDDLLKHKVPRFRVVPGKAIGVSEHVSLDLTAPIRTDGNGTLLGWLLSFDEANVLATQLLAAIEETR